MPLEIIREDITKINVDCIVNPTDEHFSGLGGTDGKIHRACGPSLRKACDSLPPLATGEVCVTDSYDLKTCKYVIHTVGPRYSSGSRKEMMQLERCYENVLSKAVELKLESIAIPLISTGTFGFPKKKALRVATNIITEFLYDNDLNVYLLVYDNEAFDISKRLYRDIKDYLSNHGIELDEPIERYRNVFATKCRPPIIEADESENDILDIDDISHCMNEPPIVYLPDEANFWNGYVEDESFNECLRRHIREKGLYEKDVYKNANLTKQAFNGIYNENSIPKKGNVLALAIGLQLDIDETIDFIEKAGYSFGRTKQDYIIRYFIENERYDIYELNEFLLSQDLPYLGSKYE